MQEAPCLSNKKPYTSQTRTLHVKQIFQMPMVPWCSGCDGAVSPLSPQRGEDAEATLAESQEFLSAVEDKKTPRFTDVCSLCHNRLSQRSN